MYGMKRWVVTGLALGWLMGSAAVLEGQRARGGPGMGPEGPRGPMRGVEMALEKAEELGLTTEQTAAIETLRGEIREAIGPQTEEMRTLRDRVRAGEVERSEARDRMQSLMHEIREETQPFQGRLRAILTEEQHEQFQRLMREARPGGRGGPRGGG